MIWFRSFCFNILALIWNVGVMLLLLPSVLLGARWVLPISRLWSRGLLVLLRVVCGLSYEVRGREYMPGGPCVVASKHESAFETLVFPVVIHDAIFVLKRELLRVPLFGWYLAAAGNVAVDRSGGAKALRHMVAEARARLAEGRTIVIFPEGTRVTPGEGGRYHPGVAALYQALEVPIVPVAVNSGSYWSRRAFAKRPGRIVVQFLPPIPPGLDRRAFLNRLRDTIETASVTLTQEAAGKQ